MVESPPSTGIMAPLTYEASPEARNETTDAISRDWTFYINGVSQRAFNVRLGEIDETGAAELTEDDVQKLLNLFREFLKWEPIVPRKPKELAKELAPLTRMLRTNVAEGANKPDSPLASIYDDWKRTLFRKPPPRSSPTRTRKHSPMDCCSPN